MFIERLNKKQDGSVYVIEEEQFVTEGKYEGLLEHDNVNSATLKVYTGSKLTGDEITNVILSIPGDAPWKTRIKLFAAVEKVYITYTTPGDTVEAEDINQLQESAVEMQAELKLYKISGHIEGGTF